MLVLERTVILERKIFVINAILNNIRRRNLKYTNIQIIDVKNCFDKLWAKECFKDIYDNGVTSDKVFLLYQINKNAQVAIKTSDGLTKKLPYQSSSCKAQYGEAFYVPPQ